MDRRRGFAGLLILATGLVGCQSQQKPAGQPVTTAWEEPREAEPTAPPSGEAGRPVTTTQPQPVQPGRSFDPIAMVNGSPLSRSTFVEELMASHGLALLEQQVMLEVAKQKTAAAKIKVTRQDVEAEYQMALSRMSLPPSGTETVALDSATSEALLQDILAERNISRQQYMLSIERNAHLRKLVKKGLVVGEDQVRAAFDRLYGERVQVRHIQLASLAECAKVRSLLNDGGDFAEVAKAKSRNKTTGPMGGLLQPLAKGSREFPPLFVEVAFALKEDQVSRAIPWGRSFHLIKLEKRFPKTQVAFEDVKDTLTERVREEMIVEKMQQMAEELLREATVRVFDAELDRQFRDKYRR